MAGAACAFPAAALAQHAHATHCTRDSVPPSAAAGWETTILPTDTRRCCSRTQTRSGARPRRMAAVAVLSRQPRASFEVLPASPVNPALPPCLSPATSDPACPALSLPACSSSPDTVRTFLAGTAEGYRWAAAHPEEAADMFAELAAAENPGLPQPLDRGMCRDSMQLVVQVGWSAVSVAEQTAVHRIRCH